MSAKSVARPRISPRVNAFRTGEDDVIDDDEDDGPRPDPNTVADGVEGVGVIFFVVVVVAAAAAMGMVLFSFFGFVSALLLLLLLLLLLFVMPVVVLGRSDPGCGLGCGLGRDLDAEVCGRVIPPPFKPKPPFVVRLRRVLAV